MMDNESYITNNYNKIIMYRRDGLVMGNNLILTFETLECPLDISYVEEIIDHFILST